MASRTVSLGSDWYVIEVPVTTAGVSIDTAERVTSFMIRNTSDQIIYLYRDTTRDKVTPIYPRELISYEINRTDHYAGGNQSLGYLRSESGDVTIPVLIVITGKQA